MCNATLVSVASPTAACRKRRVWPTVFTLQVILEGKYRVWIFVRMSVVVQTKEVVGRLRRIIENSAVVPAWPYTRCLHGCKCTTASIVAYSYNLRILHMRIGSCIWSFWSTTYLTHEDVSHTKTFSPLQRAFYGHHSLSIIALMVAQMLCNWLHSMEWDNNRYVLVSYSDS